MWEDPIVAEVRRVREQLSAQFNFDLKAIFADLRKRQAALSDRLVRQPTTVQPHKAKSPGEPVTADSRGHENDA